MQYSKRSQRTVIQFLMAEDGWDLSSNAKCVRDWVSTTRVVNIRKFELHSMASPRTPSSHNSNSFSGSHVFGFLSRKSLKNSNSQTRYKSLLKNGSTTSSGGWYSSRGSLEFQPAKQFMYTHYFLKYPSSFWMLTTWIPLNHMS